MKTGQTLYIFPYAGGFANSYKKWLDYLPNYLNVKVFEYPGRGTKAHVGLTKNLSELLDHLESELLSSVTDRFVLFGHSLGALISYELSIRFQHKYGLKPGCLCLSGCLPPDKIMKLSSISHLNDHEFLNAIVKMNGIPKEIIADNSFKEFFLPILRHDFGLMDNYKRESNCQLACPIIAYGGSSDPFVSENDLAEWANETAGESEVLLFPGDHFYIRQPQSLIQNLITQVKKYAV